MSLERSAPVDGNKEKEKRRIKFSCPDGYLNDTLEINSPETPLSGKVSLRLALSPGARIFHRVSLFKWAKVINSRLLDCGYIKNEEQVAYLQIEKGVAEISGYSFRIEEV